MTSDSAKYYHKYNEKAQELGKENFYERYVKPYEIRNADKVKEKDANYRNNHRVKVNFQQNLNKVLRNNPEISRNDVIEKAMDYMGSRNPEWTEAEKVEVFQCLERWLKKHF